MNNLYYTDIVHTRFNEIQVDNSLLFNTLHKIFASDDCVYSKFGLVFIKNNVRIFSDSKDSLESLHEILEKNTIINSFRYTKINFVDLDPYTGNWISFVKFKIPTRKADRHNGSPLRRKRLILADESEDIFYRNVKSSTNKTNFRYYIKVVKSDKHSYAEWDTNSYGLSTSTNLVFFPDL